VCTGDPNRSAIYLNPTRPFSVLFNGAECNASDNTRGKLGKVGVESGRWGHVKVETDTCRLFCVYGPKAKVREWM